MKPISSWVIHIIDVKVCRRAPFGVVCALGRARVAGVDVVVGRAGDLLEGRLTQSMWVASSAGLGSVVGVVSCRGVLSVW